MVVDRYTKAVLTVIAAALVGMLAAQLTPSANAQIARTCSGTEEDPCFIRASGPIEVYEAGRGLFQP